MAPRSPAAKAENEARARKVRRKVTAPPRKVPPTPPTKVTAPPPKRRGIVERKRPVAAKEPAAKKAARRHPVASKAGRMLADNGSTPDERSVAGSLLARADDGRPLAAEIADAQRVIATLEEANRSLQEEIGRLSALLDTERQTNEGLRNAQEERSRLYDLVADERDKANAKVETLTAQLEVAKSTDLATEVAQLKEQLRWRDEQASTRRP